VSRSDDDSRTLGGARLDRGHRQARTPRPPTEGRWRGRRRGWRQDQLRNTGRPPAGKRERKREPGRRAVGSTLRSVASRRRAANRGMVPACMAPLRATPLMGDGSKGLRCEWTRVGSRTRPAGNSVTNPARGPSFQPAGGRRALASEGFWSIADRQESAPVRGCPEPQARPRRTAGSVPRRSRAPFGAVGTPWSRR